MTALSRFLSDRRELYGATGVASNVINLNAGSECLGPKDSNIHVLKTLRRTKPVSCGKWLRML